MATCSSGREQKLPCSAAVKGSPADVMTCERRTRPLVERRTSDAWTDGRRTDGGSTGGSTLPTWDHPASIRRPSKSVQKDADSARRHARRDGWTTLTNGRRGERLVDRTGPDQAGPGRAGWQPPLTASTTRRTPIPPTSISDDDNQTQRTGQTTQLAINADP